MTLKPLATALGMTQKDVISALRGGQTWLLSRAPS